MAENFQDCCLRVRHAGPLSNYDAFSFKPNGSTMKPHSCIDLMWLPASVTVQRAPRSADNLVDFGLQLLLDGRVQRDMQNSKFQRGHNCFPCSNEQIPQDDRKLLICSNTSKFTACPAPWRYSYFSHMPCQYFSSRSNSEDRHPENYWNPAMRPGSCTFRESSPAI